MTSAATSGNGLGRTGRVLAYRGQEIHEVIARIAYARNGNADHPTATKNWDVVVDGHFMGRVATLRDAKAFVVECLKENA